MTNITIFNPIEQIKVQKLELLIATEEKIFINEDFSLFEDEEISLDVNLEIEIDFHPDYGRSVKSLKVHFLNGYDNRECEDLQLNLLEKREIENFLQQNLIIEFN